MIYTVTLNPAYDLKVKVEDLVLGTTNIAVSSAFEVAGKGINVAMILRNLDHEVTTLGFLAGFLGQEIETELKKKDIQTDFNFLKEGLTRINIKLLGDEETEVNNKGPFVSEEEKNEFLKKFSKIQKGDYLICSGSAAQGLDASIYEEILSVLPKDVFTVVDARKDYLLNTLKYKPDLIKPNRLELEEIFNCKCDSLEVIEDCARKLQKMGAQRVLVSLGEDGACLLNEEGFIYKGAIKCKANFTMGAGDSLVAGFIHDHLLGKSDKEAFITAMNCAHQTVLYGKIRKIGE